MNIKSAEYLTFDDVLILPKFSNISSRKDVDISSMNLKLPVISANMNTVTGSAMAIAMANSGGLGVLHRFWSVEENVTALKTVLQTTPNVAVSVGVSEAEKERASALVESGAKTVFIDVAHGAQLSVVEQVKFLREKYSDNIKIVAGNFATAESIRHFGLELNDLKLLPDAFKVGIGPGSVCTTRIKTGVGVPQLYAIMDCVNVGFPVVADGGIKSAGDVAKALAAGASAVMIGGLLAGTQETPGDVVITTEGNSKVYKGSASLDSYQEQNKIADWRTAEGVTTTVPLKGSAAEVLQDIEGGLRSAFTYVGASTVKEFQERSTFVKVSSNTNKENTAHGLRQ